MIDKYLELYQRYRLPHVTPLILEGLDLQRKGYKPIEAYECVANRLCTSKDPRVKYFTIDDKINGATK